MSQSANSGRLSTKIYIKKPLPPTTDDDGFSIIPYEYIFGGKPAWCQWINAHGSEFYNAASLNLKEAATVTMRYTSQVTSQCQIERASDNAVFVILSIDHVREQRDWLELKIARVVAQP